MLCELNIVAVMWNAVISDLLIVGLGDMVKIKYHNIFNQIPCYWYCDNIVAMTIGAHKI